MPFEPVANATVCDMNDNVLFSQDLSLSKAGISTQTRYAPEVQDVLKSPEDLKSCRPSQRQYVPRIRAVIETQNKNIELPQSFLQTLSSSHVHALSRSQILTRSGDLQQSLELQASEDMPLQSEHPEAREVAGYVGRRGYRTTMAEAPPTASPKQTPKSSRSLDQGKKSQKTPSQNEENSESDDDRERRKSYRNTGSGVTVRKQKPLSGLLDSPKTEQSKPDILSAEELQRMHLHRELKVLEEKWENIRSYRRSCRSRNSSRIRDLLSSISGQKSAFIPPLELYKTVKAANRYTDEYQDEALFGHITEQLTQESEDKSTRRAKISPA